MPALIQHLFFDKLIEKIFKISFTSRFGPAPSPLPPPIHQHQQATQCHHKEDDLSEKFVAYFYEVLFSYLVS